jgi:sulfotransferase family protein
MLLGRRLRGLLQGFHKPKVASALHPVGTTSGLGIEPSLTLARAMLTHKFVFVCGLHRSGTSMLADVLRSHPLISGFHHTAAPKDEGQHLQSVFPPARVYGGPGKFGFASNAHLTETSALATVEKAEKLFLEWSRYWDLSKPLLLEKSPPNLLRTRFLQAVFPPSYFVVIMRHPIAVAYATQKWSRSSIESLVQHWMICHNIFEQDRIHLKNVLVLKYEDLVANPTQTVASVCRFLEAPYDLRIPDVDHQINQRYLRMWYELRRTPGAKKVVSRIEGLYGKGILSYGYHLDEIG